MYLSISRKRIRWQWQGWTALWQTLSHFHIPRRRPIEPTRRVTDGIELTPEEIEAWQALAQVVRESGMTTRDVEKLFGKITAVELMWWVRR